MPEHLGTALLALQVAPAVAAALAGLLSAATTPPGAGGTSPSPPPGLNANDVSPGVAGFIATAAVVAASILVIRSMVGRLRRLRHRAELEAREEAERVGPTQLDATRGALRASGGDLPQRRVERPEHLE